MMIQDVISLIFVYVYYWSPRCQRAWLELCLRLQDTVAWAAHSIHQHVITCYTRQQKDSRRIEGILFLALPPGISSAVLLSLLCSAVNQLHMAVTVTAVMTFMQSASCSCVTCNSNERKQASNCQWLVQLSAASQHLCLAFEQSYSYHKYAFYTLAIARSNAY
jgi:hypothetical protein